MIELLFSGFKGLSFMRQIYFMGTEKRLSKVMFAGVKTARTPTLRRFLRANLVFLKIDLLFLFCATLHLICSVVFFLSLI